MPSAMSRQSQSSHLLTAPSLLTDLYQLTMANAAWRLGRTDHEGVFHLTFRTCPFAGGYAIAAGLGPLIDFIRGLSFSDDDLSYVRSIPATDGTPLFDREFVDSLAHWSFEGELHAVLEGTVVFPHQPILRLRGPIWQCQLLETPILNCINFQTLLATKASRICLAAGDQPVMEFGLRRAQGTDGAISASRAAYVGGCASTSNVAAGQRFGIPVAGTHAHSWVMAFESESEAFDAFATAMPHNTTLLVDTYDSTLGIRHAIETGRRMRAEGHDLAGIRLDSGDLAWLSIEARRMLDEAGFTRTRIVASNDLDEHVIQSLRMQGARIDVWGVGTRLATAFDQPAFGGVFKIGARRRPGDAWTDVIKLSEQTVKVSLPGVLGVRRYRGAHGAVADMVYDERQPPATANDVPPVIVDPMDATRRRVIDDAIASDELLLPILSSGKPAMELPDIHEARTRCRSQLDLFHDGVKRFVHPHAYPVGLESILAQRRVDLIMKERNRVRSSDKRQQKKQDTQ